MKTFVLAIALLFAACAKENPKCAGLRQQLKHWRNYAEDSEIDNAAYGTTAPGAVSAVYARKAQAAKEYSLTQIAWTKHWMEVYRCSE